MERVGGSEALKAFVARTPGPGAVDLLVLPSVTPALEVEMARHNDHQSLDVITGEHELSLRCAHLERGLKYAHLRRGAAGFLEQLLNFEVSPQGMDIGFKMGILPGLGASQAKIDRVYLLRRDALFGHTVCRFLSSFKSLPPATRPKIVFDAEGSLNSSLDTLSWARDAARVFTPATDGISEINLPSRAATTERFADLCLARAYSSCAEFDLAVPSGQASNHQRRRYVAAAYQRIQAQKGCDRRFDAEADLRELEAFLRKAISDPENAIAAWFAEALIFVLLDRAYILEESEAPVERALTLARALDDDLLEAFALRFANFTSGVSPFALECLDVASERLLTAGRLTEFVYARTNATLTAIHQPSPMADLGRSAALADFALEWTPYSDRLSSVLNAVGVSFLMANHLDEAVAYFRDAAQANGGRLHQLTALINEQIALKLTGARPDEAALNRICAAIVTANMSPKLSYHHTYLYANVLSLAEGTTLSDEVAGLLKSRRFMDYSNEDIDDGQLFSFLASRFSWVSQGTRFRGQRGDFVDRYHFLPLAQFVWS